MGVVVISLFFRCSSPFILSREPFGFYVTSSPGGGFLFPPPTPRRSTRCLEPVTLLVFS